MLQLEIIEEVFALAAEADIDLWLRGSWALDFAGGEVTRGHPDIDLFAWAVDAERLTRVVTDHGYDRLQGVDPLQRLDFTKAGHRLSVELLALTKTGHIVVPAGPRAGEAFPDGMLEEPAGRIGNLVCRVVTRTIPRPRRSV